MITKRLIEVSVSILCLLLLSACTKEPIGDGDETGGGHTLTLRLSASVSPIPETKAVVQPVRPGSEAAEAGFSYELVSSDADSTATPLTTKAPTTLKNVYALLFTSAGTFNGRAALGVVTAGMATDITFTDVASPTATGCRLVIVANDNAAGTSYTSSGGTGSFASFSGTYAAFQALTITSAVNLDTDVPYAGSVAVNLSLSETGGLVSVPLYRTLAKITFNNTFNISGGPTRSSITLYNAGSRRFATPGSDAYDGAGSTQTTAFVATTAGSNSNSNVWYSGENIRPAGSGIYSAVDRNTSKAPANACYIRIASATQSIPGNTNPSIGQEYRQSDSRSFTYDIYLGKSSVLSDFSLRRHTNYTINSEISGTAAGHEQLAASDGRVVLTKTTGESAGLVIGRFGGPSGYTTGTGAPKTIFGSYTKLLLLEPNTSRTTAADNIMKIWSSNTKTKYQPEARRYWDKTYIYSITADGRIGGMDIEADRLYAYCNELTLGGVAKGSWYVPTQAQLMMIWAVYEGIKGRGLGYYSAFSDMYWSSTEEDGFNIWTLSFIPHGVVLSQCKSNSYNVRCVRDL